MPGMAKRGRVDTDDSLAVAADRADKLLQEAIALLDGGALDRAAAYAEMARQALAEACPPQN